MGTLNSPNHYRRYRRLCRTPYTAKSAVFFVLPSAHLVGVEYILARRRPVSVRTGGCSEPGSVALPFLYPNPKSLRGALCPSPALPSLKAASSSLNRLFTGNRPTTNSFAASSCTCRNGSSPATMPHWLQCLPFPLRSSSNSEFAAQWSHGPARRLLSVMPGGPSRRLMAIFALPGTSTGRTTICPGS